MKRKLWSIFLTCVAILSLTQTAFAEEYVSSIYQLGDIKKSEKNSESVCEEEKYVLEYEEASAIEKINRSSSCYCSGGGSWGVILGDNNAIGEGVYVTNLTSKKIEVEGYTENGTRRGFHTIYPGERAWFGFWIWDGTYYFKVRFSDLSSGRITIQMKSDWYLN